MKDPYIPKLGLMKPAAFESGTLAGSVHKMAGIGAGSPATSFQQVLGNTLNTVNGVISKPDALMHEAMTTGRVDVHEVMIANAKAELTVNMTAQMVTKVVQAYDKILQIQI